MSARVMPVEPAFNAPYAIVCESLPTTSSPGRT